MVGASGGTTFYVFRELVNNLFKDYPILKFTSEITPFMHRNTYRQIFEIVEKKGLEKIMDSLYYHWKLGADPVYKPEVDISKYGKVMLLWPTFMRSHLTLFETIEKTVVPLLENVPEDIAEAVSEETYSRMFVTDF